MVVSLIAQAPSRTAVIAARPEPLEVDISETALIVIDMQNAYLSKGGYLDLVGFDVSESPRVVAAVRKVIDSARAAGVTIIYMQNGFDPDKKEAGPATAPVYHKSNPLKYMRANPGKQLITKGTWDYALVDALKPHPDDIVIHKSLYSAFAGTNLENVLRGRRLSNLLVTGVNTNVCVESTIRDAYHRQFFPIMVADATLQAGAQHIFDATVFNVERFLGWVTSSDDLCEALGAVTRAKGG
jgi:ureidoacrylate peracid hydrolase